MRHTRGDVISAERDGPDGSERGRMERMGREVDHMFRKRGEDERRRKGRG